MTGANLPSNELEVLYLNKITRKCEDLRFTKIVGLGMYTLPPRNVVKDTVSAFHLEKS